MEMKRSVAISGGRTMDGAYSFSLSIGIGLILFIGGLVVAIVFPIHRPIGMVMFPDESAGKLCLTHGDIAGYEKGAL